MEPTNHRDDRNGQDHTGQDHTGQDHTEELRTDMSTPSAPSETTEPQPSETTAPHETPQVTTGDPFERTARPEGAGAPPAPAQPAGAAAPARPRGPNAAAILLGLVCLVVAVLVILRETAHLSVNWAALGPGAVIAAGVLLLVIGV